ncbi:MAG: tRNA (guanosine(37)-N1)-methyltransferase TrmD [bacterium]
MMRFDIITLFPEICLAYSGESIINRAQKAGHISVHVHDLRKFVENRHHKVDDRVYGGGPGMVIQIEPLVRAIEYIKKQAQCRSSKILLMSAAGKQFEDTLTRRYSRYYKHFILIAGRYEGIDERIKKVFSIEEVSVGPYVLTGGELPALIVMDAVSRKITGVLGKKESLEEKRYGIGVPVYTRPEVFVYKKREYDVPQVLRSGNHKEIERWRLEHKKK